MPSGQIVVTIIISTVDTLTVCYQLLQAVTLSFLIIDIATRLCTIIVSPASARWKDASACTNVCIQCGRYLLSLLHKSSPSATK